MTSETPFPSVHAPLWQTSAKAFDITKTKKMRRYMHNQLQYKKSYIATIRHRSSRILLLPVSSIIIIVFHTASFKLRFPSSIVSCMPPVLLAVGLADSLTSHLTPRPSFILDFVSERSGRKPKAESGKPKAESGKRRLDCGLFCRARERRAQLPLRKKFDFQKTRVFA